MMRIFKINRIFRRLSRTIYRVGLKMLLVRKPIIAISKLFFGLKIVKKHDFFKNQHKYRILEFGVAEVVTLGRPNNLHDYPTEVLNNVAEVMKNDQLASVTIDKPFVCEVTNAELVGPTAVAFTQYGEFLYETSMPQFQQLPLEYSLPARALIQKFLSKSIHKNLDTACSLVFAWSKNYHHWLVDYLARIEGLEHYQAETGVKPTLIIESELTPLQIESLKLVGYDPDKCIRWDNSKIKVRKLVIPSFRRNEQVIPRQSCLWLRQRILKNLSKNPEDNISFSPRIFISRRNALCRKILNEDEVLAVLSPLGFVPYLLEKMSFAEQVRLFAQAEIIVAPHGAGLTNMIFSENPTIIELFGSHTYDLTDFFNLSQVLGFKYEFSLGTTPSSDLRKQDSNMIVNTAELLKLIDKTVSCKSQFSLEIV